MVGAEGGGRTGFRAEAASFAVPAPEVVGQDGDAADIVGVLLLNLGGPETLEDVQPFLFNLFADPVRFIASCSCRLAQPLNWMSPVVQDIIRLPGPLRFLQRPLANLISTLRAPKSMEGYASIGGGSPLRKLTVEQGEALQRALEAKEVAAKVYVGMRYWHPFTEEAMGEMKRDGVTRLVVLPLYPQFSITTSGSSLRLLEKMFREDEYLVKMQHTVIPSWFQRRGYVEAMAGLIAREMGTMPIPEEVRRRGWYVGMVLVWGSSLSV